MYRERERHSPCVQEWLNSVQTTVSNRGRDPSPSLEETCWEELRDMVSSPCPAVALLCGLKPVFALSGSLQWVGESLSMDLFCSDTWGVWCNGNDIVF